MAMCTSDEYAVTMASSILDPIRNGTYNPVMRKPAIQVKIIMERFEKV
jgi:hypothetical protein